MKISHHFVIKIGRKFASQALDNQQRAFFKSERSYKTSIGFSLGLKGKKLLPVYPNLRFLTHDVFSICSMQKERGPLSKGQRLLDLVFNFGYPKPQNHNWERSPRDFSSSCIQSSDSLMEKQTNKKKGLNLESRGGPSLQPWGDQFYEKCPPPKLQTGPPAQKSNIWGRVSFQKQIPSQIILICLL